MAITWLEKDIEWGSKPSFKRSVGYEETGRTASQVTYKVHLKLKVHGSGTSSSSYGYSIKWNIDGGSYSTIKESSPRWYGNEAYREFTKTITKSVSASGGTSSFKIGIVAGHGSSGSPNLSKSYTAKVSTFNTKPTWSSSARLTARENNSNGAIITNELEGDENSKKIPESIGSIYLSWDEANDAEKNISKYELYCQIDDGAWNMIYSGSTRNYIHKIGDGASTQGKKYDYYVKAVDSYGAKSDSLNLRQFQKNKLSGASLAVNTSIKYNTSELVLTWSGASNTNGNKTFTYEISSPNITIYNKEKLTTSGGKIKILKSGTSTDPYILFNDLQGLVSGSSAKTGTLEINLRTRNSYGSSYSRITKVSVDLKTPPTAPTVLNIGGKISTSLGDFLIPSMGNATLSWSGAVDHLGGTLTYDVYYKIGEGKEVLVNANTNTSIQIKLPVPTASTRVFFRVVAKTSYGLSASSETKQDVIHYYNPPSVSLDKYNRTVTSMTIDIYSSLSSSIPGIAFKKQSYSGNGVTENFTGTKYTASISGLVDSSAFTFTATVNDNTGLSQDVSATYKVTPATPKLSVREKGVGVGVINTGEASLVVNKDILIKGEKKDGAVLLHLATERGWTFRQGGTGRTCTLDLVADVDGKQFRVMDATRTKGLTVYTGTSGTIVNVDGNKVYHVGNKPTPADIGASPSSHNHNKNYLQLSGGNITGNLSVSENISAGASLYIGKYKDTFEKLACRRILNSQKYEARYGVSHATVKKASSESEASMWGSVIEAYDANAKSATRRYLFSNTGIYPLNDNKSYCGGSSHRFQALYCSTGTVYSSSAEEKKDIKPVTSSVLRSEETSPLLATVLKGIKEMSLYSYKYRTLENDQPFVGFLGEELEESNKEFFDLFGSSYLREVETDGESKVVRQYDIREASLNGVLMVGLQSALLEIDALKNEIKNLKKEGM